MFLTLSFHSSPLTVHFLLLLGGGGAINRVFWEGLTDPVSSPSCQFWLSSNKLYELKQGCGGCFMIFWSGSKQQRDEEEEEREEHGALRQQEGSTDHRLREEEGQTTKAGCSF